MASKWEKTQQVKKMLHEVEGRSLRAEAKLEARKPPHAMTAMAAVHRAVTRGEMDLPMTDEPVDVTEMLYPV